MQAIALKKWGILGLPIMLVLSRNAPSDFIVVVDSAPFSSTLKHFS